MRINARVYDSDNNAIGMFKITDYASPQYNAKDIKDVVKTVVKNAYRSDEKIRKQMSYILVRVYNKKRKNRQILCTVTKGIFGYTYKFEQEQLNRFGKAPQ